MEEIVKPLNKSKSLLLLDILNKAHVGIISIDSAYCIVLVNDEALKMFGYEKNELIGRPLDRLLPNEVISVHRVHLERFASSSDISKNVAARKAIAGGIAHDFNNILTGMFGYLELAKLCLAPDHAAYQHIEAASKAMSDTTYLTHQLLTFAKGGSPIIEVVNAKQVIQDSAAFALSGSRVKSTLTLQQDLWMINADIGQLKQVITNLIINAIHAMPGGGVLTIDATNIEEYFDERVPHLVGEVVCITISDEGLGIPEEQLKYIFDPYFTTKQSRSGLGLATVSSIIAKHSGHISVESEIDKGTTFSIYLPANSDPRKADKELLDNSENPKENLINILVMDDNEAILDMLTKMLTSLEYSVETATNGTQAIEKYIDANECGRPLDVVIMDLAIPGGMSGEDTINKLRDLNPDVKVIVSSGYSTEQIMSNFSEYGFKGRLVKPYTRNSLEDELLRVLSL